MTWNHFPYFALVAVLLWAVGAYAAWKDKKALTLGATVAGLLVFFGFIVAMWVSLERPPLRTMGETRLWYSFFLPFAGMVVYLRWHYKWILSFSTILATVFIVINVMKPEIHNKTLMPALQSPWFAPPPRYCLHVCLRPTWRGHGDGHLPAFHQEEARHGR